MYILSYILSYILNHTLRLNQDNSLLENILFYRTFLEFDYFFLI